jgi:H+/Cl- antiporter ClcA
MNWAAIIGVIALLIVIVDIYAFAKFGREGTLSRLIQRWGWAAHPITLVCLGMVVGGLIVHFFAWEP